MMPSPVAKPDRVDEIVYGVKLLVPVAGLKAETAPISSDPPVPEKTSVLPLPAVPLSVSDDPAPICTWPEPDSAPNIVSPAASEIVPLSTMLPPVLPKAALSVVLTDAVIDAP